MGFVLDFDAGKAVLRVTVEGQVTDEVLSNCYAAVAKYYSSHPLCRCIVDLSQVTKFAVSSSGIVRLAASPPALPAGFARILVAHTDFAFGMARMFQMLGEKTRPDLQVVRTLEEAYRMFELESPEFSPVLSE